MANSNKVLDNFKASDFAEFWAYNLNATGVVAGTPGYFTGPGTSAPTIPANITGLRADAELGTVAWSAGDGHAAWTEGQYVVLANAAEVYWSGTDWTTGRAPA
jgi:hypothetical protein